MMAGFLVDVVTDTPKVLNVKKGVAAQDVDMSGERHVGVKVTTKIADDRRQVDFGITDDEMRIIKVYEFEIEIG